MTDLPSTRRRFGLGGLAATLAIGLVLGVGGAWLFRGSGAREHAETKAEAKPTYVCPMHPSVVSDHPGD